MARATLSCALVWASITVLTACGVGQPSPEAGDVHFYKVTDKPFQRFLEDMSPDEEQWMLVRYFRMQVSAPFFNSHSYDRTVTDHTEWYKRGLLYKDLYAIYNCPDYEGCNDPLWADYWDVINNHPEWILVTPPGGPPIPERLYLKFGCCEAEDTCPQFAGDIGNPEFRAQWIAAAAALLDGGDYRGLFVDDVNMDLHRSVVNNLREFTTPLDPRTGSAMTATNWQLYMVAFLEEIREAFPDIEIVHNSPWLHEENWMNTRLQHQVDAADYIMIERGVNDAGFDLNPDRLDDFFDFNDGVHNRNRLVIHLTSILDNDFPLPSQPPAGVTGFNDIIATTNPLRQLEYSLAGWMLISNGRDLYGSRDRSNPNNWWSGFNVNLGQALGPRYQWMNVHRRDFEHGMVLLNGPEGGLKRLSLPTTHYRLNRDLTDEVTLRNKSAAILKEVPSFEITQ